MKTMQARFATALFGAIAAFSMATVPTSVEAVRLRAKSASHRVRAQSSAERQQAEATATEVVDRALLSLQAISSGALAQHACEQAAEEQAAEPNSDEPKEPFGGFRNVDYGAVASVLERAQIPPSSYDLDSSSTFAHDLTEVLATRSARDDDGSERHRLLGDAYPSPERRALRRAAGTAAANALQLLLHIFLRFLEELLRKAEDQKMRAANYVEGAEAAFQAHWHDHAQSSFHALLFPKKMERMSDAEVAAIDSDDELDGTAATGGSDEFV